MPRPKKAGFDYLSLDTDFFTNKKMNALRRACGATGLLTYFWILCKIYESGYYYKFADKEELCRDIAEDITNQKFMRTATRIGEAVDFLVDNNTLDRGLFEQRILSGIKIQEQYVMMAYKSKRNKIDMDMYCLIDVFSVIQKNNRRADKVGVNSEKTGVNSEKSTQSNSYSNTTTIPLSFGACARECEAPSIVQLAAYFRDEVGLGATQSMREAEYFAAYNQSRGWDCLPNWRGALLRWCGNMKED